MQVQRIDDVVGIERLAVVEGDALAEVEDPFGGAGLRFPALGQLRYRLVVGAVLDEAIHQGEADLQRDGVRIGRDVQAVGGAAAGHAEPERAALLRLVGHARLGEQGRGQGRADAERRRAAHEIAPADAALRDLLRPILEFSHLCLPAFAVMPRVRPSPGRRRAADRASTARSRTDLFRDNAPDSVIALLLYLEFSWRGPWRVSRPSLLARSVPVAAESVNW